MLIPLGIRPLEEILEEIKSKGKPSPKKQIYDSQKNEWVDEKQKGAKA